MKVIDLVKKRLTALAERAAQARHDLVADAYRIYVAPHLPPAPRTPQEEKERAQAFAPYLAELFMSAEYGHLLTKRNVVQADMGHLSSTAIHAIHTHLRPTPEQVNLLKQAGPSLIRSIIAQRGTADLTPRPPVLQDMPIGATSPTEAEAGEIERIRGLYRPRQNSPSTLKSAAAQKRAFVHIPWTKPRGSWDPDTGEWVPDLSPEDAYQHPHEDGTDVDKLGILQAAHQDELTEKENLVMLTNMTNYMREYCQEKHKEKEWAKNKAGKNGQ